MPGFFSPEWLDELRRRLDIVEVIGGYIPLKRSGNNFVGLCPFHNEKTPSFSVSSAKQIFHCFGCDEGGDVIRFVQNLERLNFVEAVTLLADRAGMKLPEGKGAKPEDVALKARIIEANAEAARFYHEALWTPQCENILNYVRGRGVDDATIRRFGIGAAYGSYDALAKYLMEKGYAQKELLAAGLISIREGKGISDMLRGRLIFPIIDAGGRVVGFGGRALGSAQPKYLNSPDTPVFNKRYMLYNINRVNKARGLTSILLVEGYMDVISLSRGGIDNVVATLGTALTQEQARLVSRYSKSLTLAYDGDSAGKKAILRALPIARAQGIDAMVIDLPDGQDPDNVIRRGKAAWDATPVLTALEYQLRRAADGIDLSSQEGRTEYAMRACEVLSETENPVELENHLRKLSVETGFSRDVLLSQVNKGIQNQNSAKNNRYNNNSPKNILNAFTEMSYDSRKPESGKMPAKDGLQVERQLLNLLATGRLKSGMVSPDDFQDEEYRQIALRLQNGEMPAAILAEIEDDARRKRLTRTFLQDPGCDDERLYLLAEDCLGVLALRRINHEISVLKEQVDKLTGSERTEAIRKIGVLLNESNRLKSGKKE